jgi:hypothetical protein
MENYKIFDELINGKLDDISAKDLFSRLASDDEQRLEFNSYISVTETIKANLDTFQPSSELRNRIYDKAGINMKLIDNPLNNKSASTPGFWNSRMFTGISSGLVSGVIVYLLMQFIGLPIYMKNYVNSDEFANTSQNKSIPVSDSRELLTRHVKEQKPIIKYIYVYKDKENNTESDNSLNNNYEKTTSIDLSNSMKNNSVFMNNSTNKTRFIDNFANFKNNSKELYDISYLNDNSRISVEFGSSLNWNISQETLYPAEINKFNTLAFTVFYKFNEFIKVGANVKQETFFTEYSGTEDIGSIYNYRQNSNLTTYSAVVRTFTTVYDLFKPYFQASLGVNESGIVIRPQFGFEYQPYEKVNVNIGIDYSYFRFIHQNSWFTADKVGINYGISYNF